MLEKKVGFVIPNREFAFVASIDTEINALVQDYLGTYVSAEVAETYPQYQHLKV